LSRHPAFATVEGDHSRHRRFRRSSIPRGPSFSQSYPNPKQTCAERGERRQKGRALADDEVIKVWKAAGKLGTFGQLTRLCLAYAILTRVSSRVYSAA
jgi:hypothetical protein